MTTFKIRKKLVHSSAKFGKLTLIIKGFVTIFNYYEKDVLFV